MLKIANKANANIIGASASYLTGSFNYLVLNTTSLKCARDTNYK